MKKNKFTKINGKMYPLHEIESISKFRHILGKTEITITFKDGLKVVYSNKSTKNVLRFKNNLIRKAIKAVEGSKWNQKVMN